MGADGSPRAALDPHGDGDDEGGAEEERLPDRGTRVRVGECDGLPPAAESVEAVAAPESTDDARDEAGQTLAEAALARPRFGMLQEIRHVKGSIGRSRGTVHDLQVLLHGVAPVRRYRSALGLAGVCYADFHDRFAWHAVCLTGVMEAQKHKRTPRLADSMWDGGQRVLAWIALVGLSPLIVGIAVLVRATSPGPAVFRQERPGKEGRMFTALKFRSMYTGSERATRLGVSNGDPRITPIGRVLRATKLDELPQLVNIACGHMAFVGPRPIPKALDAELRNRIRGFEARYDVRPGLTSLAQVCVSDNGLDDRLVQDWTLRFEAERRYMRNRSASYDLLVLGLTAAYVLRKVVRR